MPATGAYIIYIYILLFFYYAYPGQAGASNIRVGTLAPRWAPTCSPNDVQIQCLDISWIFKALTDQSDEDRKRQLSHSFQSIPAGHALSRRHIIPVGTSNSRLA